MAVVLTLVQETNKNKYT